MNHQDMDVWKNSIEMVTNVYNLTNDFPESENYNLTSQIRRSAISVPSNIAEGCARFSDKETLKFISIAIGSIAELETQIIIAKNLTYIKDDKDIMLQLENIKKMLLGLSNYLTNKKQN